MARNSTSFRPGQSGNPAGKPKTVEHVRDLARQQTADAISTLAEIMRDKKAPHSARVAAATGLLDRGWGRPAQAVEVSGPEGQPLLQAKEALLAKLAKALDRDAASEPVARA